MVQPPGSNHVAIVRAAMCTSLPVLLRGSTLDPVRSVGYEAETNERNERYVWLPPNVVERLKAQRRPGEGYSDVILRSRRTGGAGVRLLAGLLAALAFVADAEAQTIYCSDSFPGYRTCQGTDRRRSIEGQNGSQTLYEDESESQPRDDGIVIDLNHGR